MNEETQEQDISYSDKQVSILVVTEQLIAEKGYSATSVRDIAQQAGVNVAMISYYFGSKEKLLEALFVHRISSGRVLLQSLLENTALDPHQKIEVLVNSYVDKWFGNRPFFQIMSREPAIKEIKEISAIVNATKLRNHRIVARLIEQGQQSGHFRENIDVALLMQTIMGTLMSVFNSIDFLKTIYQVEQQPTGEFTVALGQKLKTHLNLMLRSALSAQVKNNVEKS